MKPLVSVVTPTLNAADWLERSLTSIDDQTYDRIEHIIVDGGSTDSTVDLLKERRVRWVSEPDNGQSDAINKGFRIASGQLLTWLNADDALVPGAVESVVNVLQDAPGAEWIHGRCEIRRPERSFVWGGPDKPVALTDFDFGNCLPQPGTFFSTHAYQRVGPLSTSFNLAFDVEFWIRLAKQQTRSVHIPETLSIFEVHPRSKTGSIPQHEFLVEEAIAFAIHSMPNTTSFLVGRAAAHASMETREGKPNRSRLRKEIENLTTTLREKGAATHIDPTRALAGAEVELFHLAAPAATDAVALARLALSPVWRFGSTRTRSIREMRTMIGRR